MSDDEPGLRDSEDRPGSDFERFAEERRRYAAARQEARRLKRGEVGADAEVHPWILASRTAKASPGKESSPLGPSMPPRKARLLVACATGLVGLTVIVASLSRPWYRGPGTLATGQALKPAIQVWHSLAGHEAAELQRLAAAFGADGPDAIVAHHPDIPLAVRAALFRGESFHVLVLGQNDAERLAGLGLLSPVDPGTDEARYYVPLGEPGAWSLPVVAAVASVDQDPELLSASLEFARYLERHLRRSPSPATAAPVP